MTGTNYNEIERIKQIQAMRQRTGQMEREGMYWTDEDREKLKMLFCQNIGITDIALELQRTEVAVMQQIQLLNLYEKIRRSPASKKQEGCLCKKCTLQSSCKSKNCAALRAEENTQQ